MTDTELFEIVKGHREAWPERVTHHIVGNYSYLWNDDELDSERSQTIKMLFEASFHRALMQRGDVYTHHLNGTYTVQTGDHDFTGGSLIEAYAAALEYHK